MAMFKQKPYYKKKKTYQGIWVPKTWTGLTDFYGRNIWTDGTDIYHSSNGITYKLTRETSTWTTNSYSYVPYNLSGNCIWTYKTGIYFNYYDNSSTSQYNYTYRKDTNRWENWDYSAGRPPWGVYYPPKPFLGTNIWNDNDIIYFSRDTGLPRNYVLDTIQNKWVEKTWYGYTAFNGSAIWTDGMDTYLSECRPNQGLNSQAILNRLNDTWESITWTGFNSGGLNGYNVWTDGNNTYFSSTEYLNENQKVYNKTNREWLNKTWQGLTSFNGAHIWKDGNHIYYSSGTDQYELT